MIRTRKRKQPYAYYILVGPRKDCPYYEEWRMIHESGDIEKDYYEYQWHDQREAEWTRKKAWENFKKKQPSKYLQAKVVKLYKEEEEDD